MMLVVSTILVYESIRRFYGKVLVCRSGCMEGEVIHFSAQAERPVGLEFIFADCTVFRRSMEQSGVVITVQICTGEVRGSNFGQHTRFPLFFASLTPANAGRLRRLWYDRFLPNSCQFVGDQLTYSSCCKVSDTDSVGSLAPINL
jgi:hypothetical protein